MSYDTLGSSYERIAQCLMSYAIDRVGPIFLYAEAEPGVMAEGVYQDRGNDIVYIDCGVDLGDLLFAAWESEEPEKRWSSMEFLVASHKFSASFSYEKFRDYESDRESNAVHRHFGDKPVFYPGPTFEERYEALDPKNFSSFT